MTRLTNLTAVSLILGILLLATPSAYAQRGGGRGAGVGAARGTGIGGAPSGVGGVGPSRRTAVIAGAARDGRIGNGRGGYGGNFAHPVAAVGVARRVPIGTVIEVLPTDCSMQFISEMEYYYCSGQYYQPMGSEDNQIYVAAEPYIPEY